MILQITVSDLRRACAMSSAAYSSAIQQTRERFHFELLGIIQTQAFSVGGTSGIIAWCPLQREIAIAFAGTTNMNDILNDVRALSCETGEGRVHLGFNEAFEPIKMTILSEIHDIINKEGKPDSILITGHSLGGSIAALAAAWLSERETAPTRLITFGQPRVGWIDWTRFVDARVPCYLRVVHDMDWVPDVPYSPFHHTGELLHLNSTGGIVSAPGRWYRALYHWIRAVLRYPRAGVKDHFMSGYRQAVAGLTPTWKLNP